VEKCDEAPGADAYHTSNIWAFIRALISE
jgi:hypothetical protein